MQRKQLEEKLEENEKRFRALIENSADGIALVDRQGILHYASPSIVRLTGYTPEELLGSQGFNHVHPDDLPSVLELFSCLLEAHGKTISAAFRYQHKDGRYSHQFT